MEDLSAVTARQITPLQGRISQCKCPTYVLFMVSVEWQRNNESQQGVYSAFLFVNLEPDEGLMALENLCTRISVANPHVYLFHPSYVLVINIQ